MGVCSLTDMAQLGVSGEGLSIGQRSPGGPTDGTRRDGYQHPELLYLSSQC